MAVRNTRGGIPLFFIALRQGITKYVRTKMYYILFFIEGERTFSSRRLVDGYFSATRRPVENFY